MKIINKPFDLDPSVLKSISKSIDLADLFLIDIETTGFSSMKNQIYLIGCIYHTEDGFHFIQWLCEKPEDEYELLFRFAKFIQNFHYVVHYNGTQFDMPFIKRRMQLFQISSTLHTLLEIDLYTLIRPFQKYFGLDNLKLKTVEKRYGYERSDEYTGGMLIQTYQNYIIAPTSALESDLLLHNEEDLLGLYQSLHVSEVVNFLVNLPNLEITPSTTKVQTLEDSLQLKFAVQTPLEIQIEIDSYTLLFTKTSISI
ncbi:MAG: ribonuclease H-like domain-containing protein, partial [Vallitaleaceae bacterium]|nr:ribonuclease H-like domain-containing protein [Vallitaleaceae bacterium]